MTLQEWRKSIVQKYKDQMIEKIENIDMADIQQIMSLAITDARYERGSSADSIIVDILISFMDYQFNITWNNNEYYASINSTTDSYIRFSSINSGDLNLFKLDIDEEDTFDLNGLSIDEIHNTIENGGNYLVIDYNDSKEYLEKFIEIFRAYGANIVNAKVQYSTEEIVLKFKMN